MDDSLKLYDPLAQITLMDGSKLSYQLYIPQFEFDCFKGLADKEVFIFDRSNRFSPFAWRENRQIYDPLKQNKSNMDYYTTRPTGGNAVQWKGSNLHEFTDLMPNTTAAIDRESGSLTLVEGIGSRCRQYFFHLKDWIFIPFASPGKFECYNDDEFRLKFELQRKGQPNFYGALSGNVTSDQAGCHNVQDINKDPRPIPPMMKDPDTLYPKMGGQIQG